MSFRDEKRRFSFEKSQRPESGRIHGGFVHQQDGDVIPDRVDAVAGIAFKGLGVGLEDQRLLADGTDEDFEQVLRNHEAYCTTAGNVSKAMPPHGQVLRGLE